MSGPSHQSGWGRDRMRRTAAHYHRRAWRRWRAWREGFSSARASRGAAAGVARRVLVVRLDLIGDFVLWSGAARAVRASFGRDTHVTLAANALWADVARTQDVADEVWALERDALEWNGAYRDAWRARVAAAGFDLALNPCFTREMMLGDSVVRWSRAAERVGLVGDDALLPARDRARADRWYTRLLAMPRAEMHEVERHAAVLQALGVPCDGLPEPALTVAAAERLVPSAYFVVAPGASLPEKRWPAERFVEVACRVHERTGWTPVLVGDAADGRIAHGVSARLPSAINLAGATSLHQLIAAIAGARLVLSNDSAPVHIAAAVGTHAVCLSGGWHWGRFLPYPPALRALAERVHVVSMQDSMPCFRCGGNCSLPHHAGHPLPCVDGIAVERALDALDALLPTLISSRDG